MKADFYFVQSPRTSRRAAKRQEKSSATITFIQKRESFRSYLHSRAWNFIRIVFMTMQKSDEKEKKEGKGEGYNA